ncbi:MAG: phosphatidylinositol mannoside acyltransferase [Acidimicrobiales bacterium]
MAGRARVALFKTGAALLEAAPERLDVWIGRRVATLVGRRPSTARRALTTNLARVMAAPGTPVDPALLARFVERGFDSYGRYWAEGAKLPAIPAATVVERFCIAEGREYLEAARGPHEGLVVALPHIGSWDWGGAFLAQIGLPMLAVAEVLEPPELFTWFAAKREAIGIAVTPLDDRAGAALLTALNAGGLVGLLCDRDLQGNGLEVDFFGRRVTMPAGPATLALRTGATLVAAACYSGPGRDHFTVVTPPIDTRRSGRLREDVTRVTQALAIELEGLIRRAPEQWHVLEDRFGDP